MMLGFHCIFSVYGFWLPNEPRGSWSDFVRSWELVRFGPATKVTTRRSLAAVPYDYQLKTQMQAVLQYKPVHFTGQQAQTIALSFPILNILCTHALFCRSMFIWSLPTPSEKSAG